MLMHEHGSAPQIYYPAAARGLWAAALFAFSCLCQATTSLRYSWATWKRKEEKTGGKGEIIVSHLNERQMGQEREK